MNCNGDGSNFLTVTSNAGSLYVRTGRLRFDLEKVLLHYQDDDSKLKAAEFLIQNMVGHSMLTLASVETYKSFYQRCDSIRDEYKSTNRSQWITLIDSLWDVFQAGKTSYYFQWFGHPDFEY